MSHRYFTSRPTYRRIGLAVATALVCALAASCTTSTGMPDSATGAASGPTSGPSSPDAAAAPAADVALTANVATDTPVPVDTVVTVAAANGSVTDVVLDYTDPKLGKVKVEGELAPDGTTWKARSLLEPATTYSISMTGQNVDGKPQTKTMTFNTVKLSKSRRSAQP
ncbi:MAG: Ig-like domain-containing protein [Dermatophilaceae bacterium]